MINTLRGGIPSHKVKYFTYLLISISPHTLRKGAGTEILYLIYKVYYLRGLTDPTRTNNPCYPGTS